jgi:hypothetical protein
MTIKKLEWVLHSPFDVVGQFDMKREREWVSFYQVVSESAYVTFYRITKLLWVNLSYNKIVLYADDTNGYFNNYNMTNCPISCLFFYSKRRALAPMEYSGIGKIEWIGNKLSTEMWPEFIHRIGMKWAQPDWTNIIPLFSIRTFFNRK